MIDNGVLALFESVARFGIESSKDVRLENRDYCEEQNTMGSVAKRCARDKGLTLNVFAGAEDESQNEEDTDATDK